MIFGDLPDWGGPRPWPKRLPPGEAPAGVVIARYAMPSGVHLGRAMLPGTVTDARLRTAAELAAESDDRWLARHPGDSVVIVVYDGDTGQRLTVP